MSDGGFYITPNSVGTKSLNSLVILKKEMVREGFNNIYVCL